MPTNLTCLSAILFFGFAGLDAYVYWIADHNSYIEDSGLIHCPSIIIGYSNPLIVTNYPSTKTSVVDPDLVHISVTKDWGGNLVFFNQSVPYTGSIIGLAGDKTVKEIGFDFYGVSFRWIKNVRRPDSWWTLMINFWYPIIFSGILPAIFVVKKLRNLLCHTSPKT